MHLSKLSLHDPLNHIQVQVASDLSLFFNERIRIITTYGYRCSAFDEKIERWGRLCFSTALSTIQQGWGVKLKFQV